jgi:hypothetical protein
MSSSLPSPVALAIDSAIAAALVVSLGLVFIFEPQAKPPDRPILEPPTPQAEPVTKIKTLRLAVTPEVAEFDDVGRLLDTLGEAYSYRPMPFDDLLEPAKLELFDIVFLTCSGYPENWLGESSGAQLRGQSLYGPNEATFAKAKESMRRFVTQGGTLYASDRHFNLMAHCFPEFLDSAARGSGASQTVQAQVDDPGLREIIGTVIELTFDQEGWEAAAFAGEGLTSYLHGEFKGIDGRSKTAPLLVKFPHGEGSVIFTSFHNEKQTSEKEKQLLKYLVFSAVTAGVDAEASRSMAKGGFSQTKKNLFSASTEADSVSQSYDNKAVSDLQFVLAFPEQGATLELAVTGPDGKTIRKRGTSTITIDVPNAPVGSWTYSITAVKVPSENFPFTITVGKKR